MAFTIKTIIDLRGILFLVLLTIPSHATNLDCYGKAFHCVNSTHFMICVDLGRGISTTIDDVVIPCPSPTVCKGTNHYECEFPTTSAPESEVSTVANIQTTESEITTFVPLVTSSIPFEEYFNTLSTTTLSENELQPFTTDTRLVVEPVTLRQENIKNSSTTEIPVTDKSISRDANTPKLININPESSVITSNDAGSNIENNISINLNIILNDTKPSKSVQEFTTITDIPETTVTDSSVFYINRNITSFDTTRAVTELTATTEQLLTKNLRESPINATRTDITDAINNQTTSTGEILINDFQQLSINTASTFITSAVTEQTRESINATMINSTDAINNQTVTTEVILNDFQQLPGNAKSIVNRSSINEQTITTTETIITEDFREPSTNAKVSDLYNETVATEHILTSGFQQSSINIISTVLNRAATDKTVPAEEFSTISAVTTKTLPAEESSTISAVTEKTLPAEKFVTISAVTEKTVPAEEFFPNGFQEPSINTPASDFIRDTNNHSVITVHVSTNDFRQPSTKATSTDISNAVTEQTVTTAELFTREFLEPLINATVTNSSISIVNGDINNQTVGIKKMFSDDFRQSSINKPLNVISKNITVIKDFHTKDLQEPSINATTTNNISDVNNQSVVTEKILTEDFQQHSVNATPIVISNIVTEQTATTAAFTEKNWELSIKATVTDIDIPMVTSDINKQTVTIEKVLNHIPQHPSTNTTSALSTVSEQTIMTTEELFTKDTEVRPLTVVPPENTELTNNDQLNSEATESFMLNTDNKKTKSLTSTDIITTEAAVVSSNTFYYHDLSKIATTPTLTTTGSLALHTSNNLFEKIAETGVDTTTVATSAGSITNELLRTDFDLISTITPKSKVVSEIETILFNSSLETIPNLPSTFIPTLDEADSKIATKADELGLYSKTEIVTPVDSGLVQAIEFITKTPTTERTTRIGVVVHDKKILDENVKVDSLKKTFLEIGNITENELLSTSFPSHITENKNGFLDGTKIYNTTEINITTNDIINTPVPDAYNVETMIASQNYEPNHSFAENIGKSSTTRNFLSKPTTVRSSILNTDPVIPTINKSNLSVDTNKGTVEKTPNPQLATPTSTTEFYYHTTIIQPSITAQLSDDFDKVYVSKSDLPVSTNTVLESKTQITTSTDLVQTEIADIPATLRTSSSTINVNAKDMEKIHVTANYSVNETNHLENAVLNNVSSSAAKDQKSIGTTTQKMNIELLTSTDQNEEAIATTKNITVTKSANVVKNISRNELKQESFMTSNGYNESNNTNFDFNLQHKSTGNTVATKIEENKSVQTDFNTQFLLTTAKNVEPTTSTMNRITVTTPTLILLKEYEARQSPNSEKQSVTLDLSIDSNRLPTASITSNKADMVGTVTTSKRDLIDEPRVPTAISTPSSSIESVIYSTQTMTSSPTEPDIIDPNNNRLSTFTSSFTTNQPVTKSIESETPQTFTAHKNETTLYKNIPFNTTSLIKDATVKLSFGSDKLMFNPQKNGIQNSTIIKPLIISEKSIKLTLPIYNKVKKSNITASKDLSDVANMVKTQTNKTVNSYITVDQTSLGGTYAPRSAVDYKSETLGLGIKAQTATTTTISSFNIYDKKPSDDVAETTGSVTYFTEKHLKKTTEVSPLTNNVYTEKYVLASVTPTAGLQSETWKIDAKTNTNIYTPDKRSIDKISSKIAVLPMEPIPKIINIKTNKNNEKQSNSQTMMSTTLPDFDVATDVIKGSEVFEKRNTGSVNTHSGIISFLKPPTVHQEKKGKPENKENEVEERQKNLVRTNKEEASLSSKDLPTSSTNILVATLIKNNKKEQIDISKREEVLLKTKNNHLKPTRGINFQEISIRQINNDTNIVNVTNTVGRESKKKTATKELIKFENSKSVDQNNSMLYAHNITLISNDQNSTPRSMSQTTAVGDMQTAGFPAFESTTHKAKVNGFSCKKKRGKYADELDCRKFYICIGNAHVVEGMCPVNTVFSEIRKQCTKNLSHCIRNNQFRCVSEGHFSDFLNDNVYYICVRYNASSFIRFKLICQNGYHLNKTSVRCVLNNESQQSSSKSDSSKSTSEQSASLTKQEEPEEKENTEKKFKCKKEGTFADPSNCKRYFECTKTETTVFRQKRRKCDSGENFHRDKKKCVESDSYEC